MSEVLTPAEFAARYRVPERTVRDLCKSGRLPGAYRVGLRWRIDLSEFRAGARPASPQPRRRHVRVLPGDGDLLERLMAPTARAG